MNNRSGSDSSLSQSLRYSQPIPDESSTALLPSSANRNSNWKGGIGFGKGSSGGQGGASHSIVVDDSDGDCDGWNSSSSDLEAVMVAKLQASSSQEMQMIRFLSAVDVMLSLYTVFLGWAYVWIGSVWGIAALCVHASIARSSIWLLTSSLAIVAATIPLRLYLAVLCAPESYMSSFVMGVAAAVGTVLVWSGIRLRKAWQSSS